MTIIDVTNLKKHFRLSTPKGGILGAFKRNISYIPAVDGVSFSIKEGERVAFIGPNGAGKSTTIKMLCGILIPSSGTARVLGFVPWENRSSLSLNIGVVFGSRSQLWGHLPIKDTFELLGAIYGLNRVKHAARVIELSELLDAQDLIETPASKLSLGERMRCELIASLLHKPALLFLDEPTIGLDVSARALLRDYIRRLSENDRTTILLTSHDTADISEVCDRVIIINHGVCILDQDVATLRRTYIGQKRIKVILRREALPQERPGFSPRQIDSRTVEIVVDTTLLSVEAALHYILSETEVEDLTVEDPPLEETILSIYKEARATREN
jgi:ABC-2 type transport system ATP-binding protein